MEYPTLVKLYKNIKGAEEYTLVIKCIHIPCTAPITLIIKRSDITKIKVQDKTDFVMTSKALIEYYDNVVQENVSVRGCVEIWDVMASRGRVSEVDIDIGCMCSMTREIDKVIYYPGKQN